LHQQQIKVTEKQHKQHQLEGRIEVQTTQIKVAFRLQKLKLPKARIEINPKNSHRKKKILVYWKEKKNSEGGELSYMILVESKGGETL